MTAHETEMVCLITVTAPGTWAQSVQQHGEAWADRWSLDWSEECTEGLGRHVHSGKLGCRVAPARALDWNASMGQRWRDLHRVAATRVRRSGVNLELVSRVFQRQQRGVDHVHAVVAYGSPDEKHAARLYVLYLAELASEYGFGFVDSKLDDTAMEKGRAAGYLGSYLGGSEQLEQAAEVKGRRNYYVSSKLTAITGATLSRLRRVRWLYQRQHLGQAWIPPRSLPRWLQDSDEFARVVLLKDHPFAHLRAQPP